MYRPYPFSWVPANEARHASSDKRPTGGWPDGTELTALCGRKIQAASGELAWLWPTCAECDAAARILAGLPPISVGKAPDLQRRQVRGRQGK